MLISANGIPIGSASGAGSVRPSSYLCGASFRALRMCAAVQLLTRVDEAFHNRCCTAVSEATDGSLRFKRNPDAQLTISVVV